MTTDIADSFFLLCSVLPLAVFPHGLNYSEECATAAKVTKKQEFMCPIACW